MIEYFDRLLSILYQIILHLQQKMKNNIIFIKSNLSKYLVEDIQSFRFENENNMIDYQK